MLRNELPLGFWTVLDLLHVCNPCPAQWAIRSLLLLLYRKSPKPGSFKTSSVISFFLESAAFRVPVDASGSGSAGSAMALALALGLDDEDAAAAAGAFASGATGADDDDGLLPEATS